MCAQERPVSFEARIYTGYYDTRTRGEANQTLHTIPLGARFDLDGYFLSPDLVSFSFQPEVSAGPQATEAGIQGGNGVRLRVTFLRKRAFPLTFRYNNVQVQDIFFGGLTQLSGYRLRNRNKEIGLTWEVHPDKALSLVFDLGTGSADAKAEIPEIPDYKSHQRHINADGKYEKARWSLEGFAHVQDQTANLLTPIEGGTQAGNLIQSVEQYQGAVRRAFWRDSELYFDAGAQSTSSLLFALPIDLSTRYGAVNLRFAQRSRWKSSLRAGYSSNLASQLLAQSVGSLSGPGTIAPDATILLPFARTISNINFNGTTSLDLKGGFGIYGSFDGNDVLSASQNGPLNSSYLTGTAGVTFAHRSGWGSVSGQYGIDHGYGSITGQSGTIHGQTYRLGFQRGMAGGIIFDLGVHGANQRVDNAQPLSNDSFSLEGGLAFPVAAGSSLRLGGGWLESAFTSGGTELRSNGYTARLGLDHPKYQLSVSLNDMLSNSLPLYNPLLGNLALGAAFISPLQAIPSDYRALSFSLHANPLRKVEVAANWSHSRQHIDGLISNDFGLLNIYVKYHFRKLDIESGYARFNQIFAFYPSLYRERFYLRVERRLRFL